MWVISEAQKYVAKWAKEKGWMDREVPVPEQCALLHSEVSEALEAWRNKEPTSWTDTAGKPQGIGSEYADVLVRLLHYSALLGIDLEEEFNRKMKYNETRSYRHGGKQG